MHKYLTKVICCQQKKDVTIPLQVAVIVPKLVRQLNDKRNSRKTGLLEKKQNWGDRKVKSFLWNFFSLLQALIEGCFPFCSHDAIKNWHIKQLILKSWHQWVTSCFKGVLQKIPLDSLSIRVLHHVMVGDTKQLSYLQSLNLLSYLCWSENRQKLKCQGKLRTEKADDQSIQEDRQDKAFSHCLKLLSSSMCSKYHTVYLGIMSGFPSKHTNRLHLPQNP